MPQAAAAAPVRVFGEYQVERPAPECEGSVVAVQLAGQTAFLGADGGRVTVVNASAVLPIHARYPGPAQPGEARLRSVGIAPPVVLLRCGSDPAAAWRVASPMPPAETHQLVWKVCVLLVGRHSLMHGSQLTRVWGWAGACRRCRACAVCRGGHTGSHLRRGCRRPRGDDHPRAGPPKTLGEGGMTAIMAPVN